MSARAAARLVLEGFREVYEFAGGKAEWSAYGLPMEGRARAGLRAGDLVRRDVPVVGPRAPAADALKLIDAAAAPFALVLDSDGVLLGRIDPGRDGLDGLTASEAMHPGPSTFRPDVSITEMQDWFARRQKFEAFPITTPDGKLMGVLHRSDVERALARETDPAP